MRTYVTPHEIMIKLQNFLAKKHIEGSPERSRIERPRYRELEHDPHRYVFWYACGKIKTIQQPDGEPAGAYGSRVRVWKSRRL
jgi:hypothetical protein